MRLNAMKVQMSLFECKGLSESSMAILAIIKCQFHYGAGS